MIRKEDVGPDTPPVGNRWSIQAFLSFPLDPFFFSSVLRCERVMLCCWPKKRKKKRKQFLRDTAPQRGLWIIFCLNWVMISEDASLAAERCKCLMWKLFPFFFPFPPSRMESKSDIECIREDTDNHNFPETRSHVPAAT